MTSPFFPTRRGILLGAASLLAGLTGLAGRGQAGSEPRDQGIGGTGSRIYAATPDEDRGIGGTGIYGTIRAFGSIWVNGVRVTYGPDVRVSIDGSPAPAAVLAVGQVVQVVAHPRAGRLETDSIAVVHEVVGRIERISGTSMTVLGQSVDFAALAAVAPGVRRFGTGQRVAVSGLRRVDGIIEASLISPVGGSVDLVRGPVAIDGRSFRIGALAVEGLAALVPHLAQGMRVAVAGHLRGGHLEADDARVSNPVPAGVSHVSIETYLQRTGAVVELGNGLVLSQTAFAGLEHLPAADEIRAVVGVQLNADGNMRVESVAAELRGSNGSFAGSITLGNMNFQQMPGLGPGGSTPATGRVSQPFGSSDGWSAAPVRGTGPGGGVRGRSPGVSGQAVPGQPGRTRPGAVPGAATPPADAARKAGRRFGSAAGPARRGAAAAGKATGPGAGGPGAGSKP